MTDPVPPRIPAGWDRTAPTDWTDLVGPDDEDEDKVIANEEPEQGRGPSIATQLVGYARVCYRLGCTVSEEPFAVPGAGPNVARMMRGGRSLRSELARAYLDWHGKAAPGSALTDALCAIEGLALAADREEVHLRVARYGDGLVLDLGSEDGSAVVIEHGSWRVVDCSPVVFRRTQAMSALPVPVHPGRLEPLSQLLNLTEPSWRIVVGYLVAALFPWVPHPVLLFTGEQGTAKSTAARCTSAVVDPSGAQLRRAPSERDWTAQAAASYVVCLDNLSAIAEWLSDALCRAVTGDGSVERTLFTNTDVTVTAWRRVVMLTSIDAGRITGDLAERLLSVELERIAPAQRREDAAIAAEFAGAHATILGGLLTLTADVLAALPDVRPPRLPRMADFGRVLAAVDEVKGWTTLDDYRERLTHTMQAVVDDDPVGLAVETFMASQVSWQGTASELLDALPVPDPVPKGWPRTPQGMRAVMTRLAPALAEVGITVEQGERTERRRTLVITRS
jgi:hypothetical protein